jgi:hypothetical protein
MSKQQFTRPPLADALAAWKQCLADHDLPTEMLWIYAENLCIEPSRATPGSFRIGFQTRFSPPPEDALETAYDHFCDTDERVVIYRLGSVGKKSVCILLCDAWFEEKNARDGFARVDEWRISFHPGHAGEIEEITELSRWLRRVKRDRAFHDFDFSMSLETIEELRTHGRTLVPYERFAQKMLNRLRRVLGQE